MRALLLHDIVDGLARRIGRAALVEDQRQRVIVHTEHRAATDDMRRLAILLRHQPPEAVAWLRAHGVYEARCAIRTPPCHRLRMLPRVCLPIRYDDELLGVLSFVEEDAQGLTEEEITLAAGVAADLALELHHDRVAADQISRREEEAVRELVLGNRDARERAARLLIEEGCVRSPMEVVVLVALPVPGGGPDEGLRRALTQALTATRLSLGARECLWRTAYDHGLLVVATDSLPGRTQVKECIARLDAQLSGALRGRASRWVTGVGQPRRHLAAAADSYDEALRAAQVGAALPWHGRIVHWSDLGVYRLLSQLIGGGTATIGVHPGLEEHFEDEAKLPLLETLEVFLDLAGNARATAERMHMHRATLYYRLERIAELTSADLKDGNERLSLHLALKMGRLTGRYRPGPRTVQDDHAELVPTCL